MKTESKQPHTSSLRGRQILERRREIDPVRTRPASNEAWLFDSALPKSMSNK